MPPTLQNLPADAVSHEAFWRLTAAERAQREGGFREIPRQYRGEPSAFGAYESLQPPLYYWIASPVLWAVRNRSLATQVLALRWWAVLLASPVVLLVFLVGRSVFADPRAALGCAAVVALMPELAISLARVSNECLAVPLYTLVTWLAVKRRHPVALGVALGAGLITKAYFLAAVAGVAAAFWAPRALAIAGALSGWWYIRNLWTTGTLTGLAEAVMLRGRGPIQMLAGADSLPWRTAVDAILFSHLHYGGWSSLMVRAWMYHVLYVLIATGAIGLIWLWRKPEIRGLVWIYGAFWAAQLYNVVLIYLSKGVPASMGWYLYAVVGAQAVLAAAGLRRVLRRYALTVAAALFGLLDLYAMNAVALPYYTGLIARKANGGLAGVRPSAIRIEEVFQRLTIFKPEYVTGGRMMALWVAYLLATLVLIVAAGVWGTRAKTD